MSLISSNIELNFSIHIEESYWDRTKWANVWMRRITKERLIFFSLCLSVCEWIWDVLLCMCVCVCIWVCVSEYEMCLCVCAFVCLCLRECAWVRVWVFVFECMCVSEFCVWECVSKCVYESLCVCEWLKRTSSPSPNFGQHQKTFLQTLDRETIGTITNTFACTNLQKWPHE